MMEIINKSNMTAERRRVGLELHQAETALGIGRHAIRELLTCEPVDQLAVAQQKAVILEARLSRNDKRQQLKAVKARERPLPRMDWYGTGM